MMLPYEYPVVYFYSEDPEDSEVIQKQDRLNRSVWKQNRMRLLSVRKDTAFISCLVLSAMETSYVFLTGIPVVNWLV